ncbi:HmuY domain protein [Leptospira vanthielii serovar Holland str. Waz Holland = ATCC 700522]|uniref:HmuY domain protein n=1 Tax=Leptospira vanthielii serovar Holland str. Waz Holland = ATCC 700522 TaxID=1218591 RepID=N1W5S4_9LEPT|nr:HmuY domain protein [Leptospira vanthielii serovar Holland str. Waz Holland = ATCC 700522]
MNLKANAAIVGAGDVWDLRFKRYNIGTNSGTSGTGNGGACSTGSTDFSATYVAFRVYESGGYAIVFEWWWANLWLN